MPSIDNAIFNEDINFISIKTKILSNHDYELVSSVIFNLNCHMIVNSGNIYIWVDGNKSGESCRK